MLVNGTSGLFKADWFTYKGQYGVLKEEYREQMAAALAAAREQSSARLQSQLDNLGCLTKQQAADLAKKYDPQNMTREEYAKFVEELCSYGVIPEDGRSRVSGLSLTPLEDAETGAQISVATPQGVSYALQPGQNNILAWVKYRASFEEFDPTSQTFKKSSNAKLFAKIEQALEQMMQAW